MVALKECPSEIPDCIRITLIVLAFLAIGLIVIGIISIGLGFLTMWIFSVGLGEISDVGTLFAMAIYVGLGVLMLLMIGSALIVMLVIVIYAVSMHCITRCKYWCEYETIEESPIGSPAEAV